jgi:hypothetical protein
MNTCRSCDVAVESRKLICAACRLSLGPVTPAFKFTIANPLFWSLAFVALALCLMMLMTAFPG